MLIAMRTATAFRFRWCYPPSESHFVRPASRAAPGSRESKDPNRCRGPICEAQQTALCGADAAGARRFRGSYRSCRGWTPINGIQWVGARGGGAGRTDIDDDGDGEGHPVEWWKGVGIFSSMNGAADRWVGC